MLLLLPFGNDVIIGGGIFPEEVGGLDLADVVLPDLFREKNPDSDPAAVEGECEAYGILDEDNESFNLVASLIA